MLFVPSARETRILLAVVAGCAVAAAGAPVARAVPDAARRPAPDASPAAEAPRCDAITRIEIEKAKRLIRARCAGGPAVVFRASLGRHPLGRKERRGDLRTPEGSYRVAEAPRESRFHRFIALDYPSRLDAAEALAERRISRQTYFAILEAHERGVLPPQDTPLGGYVGIHGEGVQWQGASRRRDWTLGCIAVSDAEIDFLAERVMPGTAVVIYP